MKTLIKDHSSAVILARVSSKAQEDEGYSLDSQLKLLQGYCDSRNLHVIKVFKIAETASKEQSRKVFHELLTYLTKENIYHLAVEKTDRLTRNFRDAIAIDDWLEKDIDRRLHAVKENLLLHKEAKSDVKFMWNIHLSVAKKYSDNLREEAMKGWAEKLAQGWMPAPPPPGYKTVIVNGKRIHEPDEETKFLIERAFKLYLDPSQSIQSITEELQIMGIRNHKGREYHKSQVQHMLRNPYYIGIIRFDGKEYPGAQVPIISKELFEQVQNKLQGKRSFIRTKHNPVFKNLIYCRICGSVVTWQLQKKRYYGYCKRSLEACKGRTLLREDKVEAAITSMLEQLVCPSAEIIDWLAESMKDHYAKNINNSTQLIGSIQSQINRLNRMDESLYDDKLSGEITQARYKDKHQNLINQINELEQKLAQVDTLVSKDLDQKLILLELSQKAAKLYQNKSPEVKRLIISKLFSRITYEQEFISVEYTNFAKIIAQNVIKTNDLLGGKK